MRCASIRKCRPKAGAHLGFIRLITVIVPVVVETGGPPLVVGGDVAVWFGELDEPHSEGQLRVRALEPELVWLAHVREPWRPRTM